MQTPLLQITVVVVSPRGGRSTKGYPIGTVVVRDECVQQVLKLGLIPKMRLRSIRMPSFAFNQKQKAEACNGRGCTILDPILFSDQATHLEIYQVSGKINP